MSLSAAWCGQIMYWVYRESSNKPQPSGQNRDSAPADIWGVLILINEISRPSRHSGARCAAVSEKVRGQSEEDTPAGSLTYRTGQHPASCHHPSWHHPFIFHNNQRDSDWLLGKQKFCTRPLGPQERTNQSKWTQTPVWTHFINSSICGS